MKKTIFILLVLSGIFIFLDSEPAYTPTAIASLHSAYTLPRIIAHKARVAEGYTGNSIQALQQAALSNIQGLEVDVRFSRDGIPFLFHADTLEETTNGVGKPEDHVWNELAKLRYKDGVSSIATLSQLFDLVETKKTIFLDIKDDHIFDRGFEDAVAGLIEKHRAQDTVIVESFNPFFLTYMRLRSRDIMIMYDFVDDAVATGDESQTQLDRIPSMLKNEFLRKQIRRILRPDLLGPKFNVAPALLKKLIDSGYPLVAWTVDDEPTAGRLLDLGVIGLQTNKPIEMIEKLKSIEVVVVDAGGTKTDVARRVYVTSEQDVVDAIATARSSNLRVSIAGRRHSMGGQSAGRGSINLDMLGYSNVTYDPRTQLVTAQAGATWKKLQNVLDPFGRSVSIMQSDNIFTVGGSISVNAHGWQLHRPPLGSSIRALKIAMADGSIRQLTPESDPDLFHAIVGGYGQMAVILEATLETAPNSVLKLNSKVVPLSDFERVFQENVSLNPKAELGYARIGMSKFDSLDQVGIFWYERIEGEKALPMNREGLVAVKRAIFRSSDITGFGKDLRWWIEKRLKQFVDGGATTRNTVMSPDVHVLWPTRTGYRDILHEYFLPKARSVAFVGELKRLVKSHHMDLLNVTIRDVLKDSSSALPYAREDSNSFVLFFAQAETAAGENEMKSFTIELIREALKLGGSFYLPYRMHYTGPLLRQAYPDIGSWLGAEFKYDPSGVFESDFSANLKELAHSN
jgi:FAD/FMN-containing dehydrogenase/glycerophosphoryl diester phosphodiesterase